MRIGYLGAGNISSQMAATVARMDEAENYAVAARDADRARTFANTWGFERAYGSYEELLADPAVDLVYVALPHSHHHRWTIAALEAGHHVLCEKAFAANAAQAKEMIECARSRNLLLAEAIWTRYMPSRTIIDDIIASGAIGRVLNVDANLGYKVDMNERMVKPELCGGALLDLTVYPLNFASMVMGDEIERVDAHMVPIATGVDGQDSIMLTYRGGRMATMFTTMHCMTDRRGLICGTDGFIMVENINNPQGLKVFDESYRLIGEETCPPQLTGYEYEVLETARCIREGLRECPSMPHGETLHMMELMDHVRAQMGIHYPCEDVDAF